MAVEVVVEVVHGVLMMMVVVVMQEAVGMVRRTVVAIVEVRVTVVEVQSVIRITVPREVDAQQRTTQTLEGMQQRFLSFLVLYLVLRLVLCTVRLLVDRSGVCIALVPVHIVVVVVVIE